MCKSVVPASQEVVFTKVVRVMDFGARMYDPATCRFTSPDAVSELAPELTPYRYGFNNPILYIDPDGLFETKAQAEQYAKDNGIKTGFWHNNKIKKQEDGTYAITNGSNGKMLYYFGSATSSEVAEIVDSKPVDRQYYADGTPMMPSGALGQLDGANDPFFNLFTLGQGSTISSGISVSDNLGFAAFNYGDNGLNLVDDAAKGINKTSGWVKKSVFNSLDPAIQKKVAAAIEKGIVAPTGKQGIIKLTASEAAEKGYLYKIKILGKGGDIRIYGNPLENGHILFDKIMGH